MMPPEESYDNANLRNITNSFLDVRLVSLNSWRQANEISRATKAGHTSSCRKATTLKT